VDTSTLTGEGIEHLRRGLLTLALGTAHTAGTATLTNLRQKEAVERATKSLTDARTATQQNIPHEMLLLDLYESLRALDELTGQTTPDDVLNLIFSTFCIGK
jgi:tRNA modification GTPase